MSLPTPDSNPVAAYRAGTLAALSGQPRAADRPTWWLRGYDLYRTAFAARPVAAPSHPPVQAVA